MALNSPNPAAIVIKGIGEAPVDGQQYTRQDADWVVASGGGGIVGVSTFTTSGNWVKADREAALGSTISKVIVEVQGGGGTGRQNSGSSGDRSGGGGGGYARKIIDVSEISSATAEVGIAGGGKSEWRDGTNTLIGGGGGNAPSNSYGPGGVASGGDLNIDGGYGYYTHGGGSFLGNSGGEPAAGISGTVAQGYGTGGSGGHSYKTSPAQGIVIVTEMA